MNNLLTNPIGIDTVIQGAQVDLYRELCSVWGGDIQGYGRVYKNPAYNKGEEPIFHATSEIVYPEWYNSEKKGYEDVYFDSSKSCVFSFLKGDIDTSEDEFVFSSRVKVAFLTNLEKLYPNEKERNVSRVHLDAVNVLRDNSFQRFKVSGIEERMEVVFESYDTTRIRFDDMHPYHCFAVVLDMQYHLNCI